MSDTLMSIIGIFLAVILMFIFPLMEMASKNDEISQTVVQTAVADFVNKIANQGKITDFDYNALIQKIGATGNSYDVQIEAQIIDDNPRRATSTENSKLLGEYKYYSVYTNAIIDEIENSEEHEYPLKKDDYVIVTVKNTNITLGTQLKNTLYKLIGKETYTIGTSSGALVLNAGNDKIVVATSGPTTPAEPEPTPTPTPTPTPEPEPTPTPTPTPEPEPEYEEKAVIVRRYKEYEEKVTEDLEMVVVLDCESSTMRFHVTKKATDQAEDFLENIVSAVEEKGNVTFILSDEPNVIYRNGRDDIDAIVEAVKNLPEKRNLDDSAVKELYVTAATNALKVLDESSEDKNKCFVFLSYTPGYEYLEPTIRFLYQNRTRFDVCYTLACCGNVDEVKHPNEERLYEQWKYIEMRYKGNIKGDNIEDKLDTLINNCIVTKYERTRSYTYNSRNLEVFLGNYNYKTTSDDYPKIFVNDVEVDRKIVEKTIYRETGQKDYYAHLDVLYTSLNMSATEWNNASIIIEYIEEDEDV